MYITDLIYFVKDVFDKDKRIKVINRGDRVIFRVRDREELEKQEQEAEESRRQAEQPVKSKNQQKKEFRKEQQRKYKEREKKRLERQQRRQAAGQQTTGQQAATQQTRQQPVQPQQTKTTPKKQTTQQKPTNTGELKGFAKRQQDRATIVLNPEDINNSTKYMTPEEQVEEFLRRMEKQKANKAKVKKINK